MKRIFKIIGIVLLVFILALAGVAAWMHQPYPELQDGSQSQADQVARKMLEAVNDSAWQETKAVSWNAGGMRQYLWDKDRGLAQITWNGKEVLLRLGDQSGKAFAKGKQLQGEELENALQTAWEFWCNDSFWLNPITKLFDKGTSRYLVKGREDQEHLLVRYTSGGVTPGDSYLWTVGKDGWPETWEMWVDIIPVGGVKVGWGGWKQLSTGAWVASEHRLPGGIVFDIINLKGAYLLEELLGEQQDPFNRLMD